MAAHIFRSVSRFTLASLANSIIPAIPHIGLGFPYRAQFQPTTPAFHDSSAASENRFNVAGSDEDIWRLPRSSQHSNRSTVSEGERSGSPRQLIKLAWQATSCEMRCASV